MLLALPSSELKIYNTRVFKPKSLIPNSDTILKNSRPSLIRESITMETVSNLTSAASRAIWGDPKTIEGEEPRSGETGDVSAGEPYDKGNLGRSQEKSKQLPFTFSKPPTKSDPISSEAISTTTHSTNPVISSTAPIRTEHETSKTGVSSLSGTTSSNHTSSTGPTSVGALFAAQDTTKQGANKTTELPNSYEHASKVDTSGAGSKPLSERTNRAGVGGNGAQKESMGEATGEKYVRSSGMMANGGAFDATNPGAGKEADRESYFSMISVKMGFLSGMLIVRTGPLETQGTHHERLGSTSTTSKIDSKESDDVSDSGSPSGGKLKGLKQKIKAKLHKNKE